MDSLVQTLCAEFPTQVGIIPLLEIVPQFVKEAETLAVPGAERKTVVLGALHKLIDMLKEQEKVGDELAAELHIFVDGTVATTINLLIAASKGSLRMPQSMKEVTQTGATCVGFLQSVSRLVKLVFKTKATVAKAASVDATVVAEVTVVAEAAVVVAEATEVAEATPEAVEATPEATEVVEATPEVVDAVAEATPEVAEATPEVAEATPEVAEATPEVAEATEATPKPAVVPESVKTASRKK